MPSTTDPIVLAAFLAAIPATIAAGAAIVSAVKTNSGNNDLTELRREVGDVKQLVTAHVNDHRAHRR